MQPDYLRLFFRGWLIVTLTAANVVQISARHYGPAIVVGFLISLVWWHNSRNAARSDLPWSGVVYALGAALGTASGMILARA